MNIWSIGDVTIENPQRLREALTVFNVWMGGRPFRKQEQIEFQGALIDQGLVDSERRGGDDGARKFANAFKKMGLVTDWSGGRSCSLTDVGTHLIRHAELETDIFLRQLLKYQLPSPLHVFETQHLRLRPFRLFLRFLRRAYEEGMVGLTKSEIGLYVITTLTEDKDVFESVFSYIRGFRAEYDRQTDTAAKDRYADRRMEEAQRIRLRSGVLIDYADSNRRYALMSGLLTLSSNKLAISEARLPHIDWLLSDGTTLIENSNYLNFFYNPQLPEIPTDNRDFLRMETTNLLNKLKTLSVELRIPYEAQPVNAKTALLERQVSQGHLYNELTNLREVQFYDAQRSVDTLRDIEDGIRKLRDGKLLGSEAYVQTFFERAMWRLFSQVNDTDCIVSGTQAPPTDEKIRPFLHTKRGTTGLVIPCGDFNLVCGLTLLPGSRQFAAAGESFIKHVYEVISKNQDVPVYGLFVTKRMDPNTADAFHNARYWENWKSAVAAPVVALEIDHVLALVQRLRQRPISIHELRQVIESMLRLQADYQNGPEWFRASVALYESWLKT